MPRTYLNLISLIILLSCATEYVQAGWSVDLESGLASNGYNDVRIPGDTGSDLSLSEELKADRTGFVRARISRDLGDRQRLSILVAPLRFKAAGSVARDIDFNDVRFSAGTPLESRYRFDSYRVTYNYTVFRREWLSAGLGLTAKIRDASIRIEGGGSSSEKVNTGFVPLINFSVDWSIASRFGLLLDGDALAAPQGRAEDVLLAVYGRPTDELRLRIGYRILEGGADNDEVYTFTLVHYISAGVTWSF